MVWIAIRAPLFLMARASRDVGFQADDGLDPGKLRLGEEVDRPVEHAVIRERDRGHASLGGQPNHVGDSARPIEQAEFRVSVEMNEAHPVRSSLATASMW